MPAETAATPARSRAPRLAAAAALAAPAAATLAGDSDDWATITDAGNAPYIRDAFDDVFDGPVGSVDYEYRIAKTEVTYADLAEFAQAYRPHWAGTPNSFFLTGSGIFTNDDGQTYQTFNGWENVAADMSWQLAATYCNWLHNNKATNRAAFETGAYDMSDWDYDQTRPTQFISGTTDRLAGARYWIPTQDEWVKAAFYDPNRFGQWQGGYWDYVTSSDTWADFDETSSAVLSTLPPPPVGAYPDVTSPWGLLDTSGGVAEWLGDRFPLDNGRVRFMSMGSSADDFLWMSADNIDWEPDVSGASGIGLTGLRLASRVPAPASVAPFCVLPLLARRRR